MALVPHSPTLLLEQLLPLEELVIFQAQGLITLKLDGLQAQAALQKIII